MKEKLIKSQASRKKTHKYIESMLSNKIIIQASFNSYSIKLERNLCK